MTHDRIMGRVAGAFGTAKDKVWEKVEERSNALSFEAQNRFVNKLAKDEGCTYQEALDMCTPHSATWNPQYSMGYKMQQPYVTLMLASDRGRQAFRDQQLLPEELPFFDQLKDVSFRDLMTDEERRQKKKQKKELKRKGRERAQGLETQK